MQYHHVWMMVDADMVAELGRCGLRLSEQHPQYVVRTCVAQALFQTLGKYRHCCGHSSCLEAVHGSQNGEGNGQFYFILANNRKLRMAGFCGIRLKLGCLERGNLCWVQKGLLQTPAICIAAAVG